METHVLWCHITLPLCSLLRTLGSAQVWHIPHVVACTPLADFIRKDGSMSVDRRRVRDTVRRMIKCLSCAVLPLPSAHHSPQSLPTAVQTTAGFELQVRLRGGPNVSRPYLKCFIWQSINSDMIKMLPLYWYVLVRSCLVGAVCNYSNT